MTSWIYSRSQKVGNPIASVLKTNVQGIPALVGLNPVSNFMEFTVLQSPQQPNLQADRLLFEHSRLISKRKLNQPGWLSTLGSLFGYPKY